MSCLTRCLLLSFAISCLLTHNAIAKTIFRRTDKISDNFKQLNLPAEEIDPNVAPPEPQKVQTIDPDDVSGASSQPAEEVQEEVEEINEIDGAAGGDAAGDVIDETINEVDNSAAAPAAAASSSASASSASTTVAPATPIKDENDANGVAKYCKCSDSHCDCCRDFGLPLIPVRGPGCAKITYLGDQRMSVSIKYGDITLATRTISGKKARPICVGLPGGFSQFCGRVYGLSKAKENFKACLGFELRADDEVEASLRVSCFKFGPEGLRVADAEPLPSEVVKGEEDEDDDDIFGFGAGGDDEDDEEEDDDSSAEPEAADNENEDDDDYANDEVEAPVDADYGGFSLGNLIDELTDDDDGESTPNKPAAAAAAVTPAVGAVRTPSTAVDATRSVGNKGHKSSQVQSKDDKGTEAEAEAETAAATPVVSEEAQSAPSETASAPIEEAAVPAVTPAPAVAEATTAKSKKSKKSKKNKKKKKAASANSEPSFASQFFLGMLDLLDFNGYFQL